MPESRWNIVHSTALASNFNQLSSHALQRQRQSLLKQRSGNLYKYLVPPEQPASYLMIEPRFIARLRARIRLNRPSFNASLSTRRIVFSDTCPHCESREDIQHVLLECYAYEAARHRLQNALWSLVHGVESPGWSLFGSLHGVRAVTGEVSHVPPRCRLEVLRLSAAFLLDVDAIRPI